MAAKGDALSLLINLLQSGDKEGFAHQLEQNSWNILVREREKLIKAGLSDAEGIQIPLPEMLELAESHIHFSTH